jgi:hypothetical protein
LRLSCGINLKGRGKKLKVNYRTTEETRRFAVALLECRDIDDLDGGQDQQKGYMSLIHGEPPGSGHLPRKLPSSKAVSRNYPCRARLRKLSVWSAELARS